MPRRSETYYQENVLRLEISVCNLLVVNIADRCKDCFACLPCFSFGVNLLFHNPLQEITTFHFFHYHKYSGSLLKYIVELNNVRTTTQQFES